MRKLLVLVALSITGILFSASVALADVWVNGYYRDNGTYVEGYWRSSPDNDPTNNFSYPGNTNPYTGVVAPGNPDTYLKNYSGNSIERDIKEAQDKLRRDQEAQRRETEAMRLQNTINAQRLNNSSGNTCSYPTVSSCSLGEKQMIMNEWEQAKSRARSNSFRMGTVGSPAEQESLNAVNNEYENKIRMCQNAIDGHNKLVELYNQCSLRVTQEPRQYQTPIEAPETRNAPQTSVYDRLMKEAENIDTSGQSEDMRVKRMIACVRYLGTSAAKNPDNQYASSVTGCKCADGDIIVDGTCASANVPKQFDSICREHDPNSKWNGRIPKSKDGIEICKCEEGYTHSNSAKRCVTTIIDPLPTHEQIIKELKKKQTLNNTEKVSTSTPRVIDVKNSGTSKDTQVSTSTIATTTLRMDQANAIKEEIKHETKKSILGKINVWFISLFK